MACLSGQKLIEIRVNSKTGFTEFSFDLGAVLRVRRFEVDDDADLWTLYKPNGYTVSVKGDGTFTHAKGTARNVVPIQILQPGKITSVNVR
jgi:hypothetical protein